MNATQFRRCLRAQLPKLDPIYAALDEDQAFVLEVGAELGAIVKQASEHCAPLGYTNLVAQAEPLVGLCDVEKARAFLTACIERTQPEVQSEFLTPPQAAKLLNVNPGKVLDWIRSGELKADNLAEKQGGRPRWRIHRDYLETFRETRRNRHRTAKPKKAIPPADVIRFY